MGDKKVIQMVEGLVTIAAGIGAAVGIGMYVLMRVMFG